MKKLGLVFRETLENRLKKYFKESQGLFIVGYSKLSSPDLTTLRKSLKGAKAKLFVTKNSVARRALKDSGLEGLIKSVEGPCGLVFAKEEPVDTSRVLYGFFREHEQLKLEAGFLEDKILDKKDIERMARLPCKEILRYQAVMALKSPIFGLVMVLKGNLRKLVYCLEQIKKKKEN
ncbi:MAG: 50S ribosomal protein L10 [Candidatus Omnitrophica bacterium]|nr:50S ribosomal protein L10 [Candidatus Omnitrophota bacterium]MDD5591803.1 50S ribosomal protein L10 [Candidatus Omnitrophota bacterium]